VSAPDEKPRAPLPAKLALTVDEAAEVLSISADSLERHLRGRIAVIRVGSLVRYPVAAIEAFLRETAEAPAAELERRRRAIREAA
jgi:excisionase family DNA binding protein